MDIGPTDGNLYALRQREAEIEAYEARMKYVMVDCPDCNGTGEIEVLVVGRGYGDPDGIYDVEDCDACGGMGEIETEQYEEEEDQ